MPLGAHKAAIMGVAGVSTGDVVLIYDTDHSNVSSVEITSGITSTYGEYIFKFYNVNPATDGTKFRVQFNGVGESGFNETITSTFFRAWHYENDSETHIQYLVNDDQAQGTAGQDMTEGQGSDTDENAAVTMHLFNPSSTTYVKHFYGFASTSGGSAIVQYNHYFAGYINTTTAIDEVEFKMSSGNFDGTIKMWGVK
jgi:hypothetical protein